ncbi:MAG TPA: DsbA family protein [Pirellulales bacterium]|nr:DsbA family protein [Pirellulales bacterium]
MSRNQTIIAVVAVVIVLLAAAGYYLFFPSSSSSDAIPADAGASGGAGYTVTADDHTLGSPKAKVTVIEYAAPTCPHCAHFNETVFPQLKAQYIDTGKIYYVFRVFPLHPSDGAAEAMAECLPKDQYFQFIDLLFRNQPQWDWEYQVTDIHGGLVKMGRIAGMTPEQVDKCIQDKAVQDRVNKVAQDAQAKYNISATPTFVINGYPRTDVASWPDMQKALDALLAKK